MAKASPKKALKRPPLMKSADRLVLKQLLGVQIKRFRLQKGLSPLQFYSLSGIDTGNLRKYESGARMPSLPTIMIIAKALEMSHLVLLDVEFKMGEVA